MVTFLTVVYVIVCLFLILVVLLQAGKGGGMGSAFGGGASQSVFGGAGATNFLQRLTVASAALFMILSATLAYLSSSSDKSLERAVEAVRMREEAREVPEQTEGEATPAPASGAQSSPEEAPAEGAASEVTGEAAPAEGAEPEGTAAEATGEQAPEADENGAPEAAQPGQ